VNQDHSPVIEVRVLSAAIARAVCQWLGLGFALCACVAAPAWSAEPAGDPGRANAIYKDAKERLEAGDTQKALELATEAERIFPHASITFLKGRVLRRLGRLHDAEEAYRTADSPQLPKALHRPLDEERKSLAEEMKAKGELRVLVQPANARVKVDGEVRTGTFQAWLDAGRRRVEIAAPGHQAVVRSVEVQAGETSEITVVLQPMGSSIVLVVPGGLRGVEVLVDGIALDLADGSDIGDRSQPQPVAAGKHSIVCSRGDKRVAQSVDVGPGVQTEVDCGKVGRRGLGALPVGAIGWGGVGVGALVMGYGAWGLGSYYLSDADDPRGVQTTNKKWLGSVYALSGAATGVLSYFLLVRPAAAAKSAPAADVSQATH